MKKNFRYGFSYIELVFAMFIVVILMAISAPFLTKKNYSNTGGAYGEYHCWAAYVCNSEGTSCDWKLKEKSRYNTSDFDNPEGKIVDQCKFMKPVGVNDYTITLVSGGGGGSMAVFNSGLFGSSPKIYSIIDKNDFNEKEVAEYTIVKRNYVMKVKPGVGGESGNVITFNTILKSFDDDNEIKISLCNTNYADNFVIKNATNQQCVGRGGNGAEYFLSTPIDYSKYYKGTNLKKFYELLSVYDDKIYSGDNYFGTGDGHFGSGVVDDKGILENNALNLKSSESDIRIVLAKLQKDVEPGTNTGSIGDYTHFVTGVNNENEYCMAGNCLVPGGKYGEIKNTDNEQEMDIKYDCEKHESGGKTRYYCFGFGDTSKFKSYSTGKINSKVAQRGNTPVEIYNKSNGNKWIWPTIFTSTNLIASPSGSTIISEKVSSVDYGAGGGGGGFTFVTEIDPSCKFATQDGSIELYADAGLAEEVMSNITCKGSKTIFQGKSSIKRTNGGRGSGGAIIIKW